ncbi:MAG: hypothetical protein VX879_05260 [Pseudomonadota bacterium]|nr:hypothetical protein [Pseudomonadota bacterium]
MAKQCDFDKPGVGAQKAVEQGGLSSDAIDKLSELSAQGKAHASGIAGGKMDEAVPERAPADCEIIMGEQGRYIVFGRDRPAGLHPAEPGKGNKGHTKAAMIDLYVGPQAAKKYIKDENADGDKYKINPCMYTDSARVYISQKCDIDDYMGLAEDTKGVRNSHDKSAVALKADAIRIVAREGVKIISGADSNNSRGAKNNKFQGIDLIGGNNTGPGYEMEPLVKGFALQKALKGIYDAISANTGMIQGALMHISTLGAVLGSHVHETPFGPSIVAAAGSGPIILVATMDQVVKCVGAKQNLAFAELGKLANFSSGHILSRCNRTN